MTMVMAAWLATPVFAQSKGASNSIFVFGGRATEDTLARTMYAPWTIKMDDIGIVGASYSHRFGTVNELAGDFGIGRIGDDLSIEAEIGSSHRYGLDPLNEVWTALYLRYDGLPWNDTVYTTIAVNTGVSLLMDESKFEVEPGSGQHASRLLHYFAPEITIANPDHKDMELVFRLHHRSSLYGLFDDFNSGSTFVSVGVRLRF